MLFPFCVNFITLANFNNADNSGDFKFRSKIVFTKFIIFSLWRLKVGGPNGLVFTNHTSLGKPKDFANYEDEALEIYPTI